MSKSHRGKILRSKPDRGRGTCPICKRTSVKLVFDVKSDDGNITVCKRCRNKDLVTVAATPTAEAPTETPPAKTSTETPAEETTEATQE